MKTTRFTERTYRAENGDWVKVTRDNKKRTFTHALGRFGNFTAEKIETLPFKWCANWQEAQDRANSFFKFFR